MAFIRGLPVIGDFLENRPKVAVIRFSGVIADSGAKKQGISHACFGKIIDKAFDKVGTKAVALVINSPGGAAAQSSLIAGHIRQRAEEKEMPVYAFVEDVAASGGYWLACAADEIHAQECSIVGSIGVISASFGFEDFIEKHEIHRRLHTSGLGKSFLDPFLPEKKEDVARLETIQKEIHIAFKEWVQERRAEKLSSADEDLFDGSFWTGMSAMEKGIIDGIGDVRSVMRRHYGDDVKLVEINPEKKGLLSLPFLGRLSMQGFADEALEVLETRSLRARFGL